MDPRDASASKITMSSCIGRALHIFIFENENILRPTRRNVKFHTASSAPVGFREAAPFNILFPSLPPGFYSIFSFQSSSYSSLTQCHPDHSIMPPRSFDHDTITIFIIIITVLVIMVIIFMATRIPRNYFGGKTASTRLFRQSSMITFHSGKYSKKQNVNFNGICHEGVAGSQVPLAFFHFFCLKII